MTELIQHYGLPAMICIVIFHAIPPLINHVIARFEASQEKPKRKPKNEDLMYQHLMIEDDEEQAYYPIVKGGTMPDRRSS